MTLRDLRKQAKMTTQQVADKLGKSRQALEHYEKGLRSIGLSDVMILKDLYDCSAEEIINAQLNSCQSSPQDNQW